MDGPGRADCSHAEQRRRRAQARAATRGSTPRGRRHSSRGSANDRRGAPDRPLACSSTSPKARPSRGGVERMERKVQQVHGRARDDGLKEAPVSPEQGGIETARRRGTPTRRVPSRRRRREQPGCGRASRRPFEQIDARARRGPRRRATSATDQRADQGSGRLDGHGAKRNITRATARGRRRWRRTSRGSREDAAVRRRRRSTSGPAHSSSVTASTESTAARVPRRQRLRAAARSAGDTSASTSVPPP